VTLRDKTLEYLKTHKNPVTTKQIAGYYIAAVSSVATVLRELRNEGLATVHIVGGKHFWSLIKAKPAKPAEPIEEIKEPIKEPIKKPEPRPVAVPEPPAEPQPSRTPAIVLRPRPMQNSYPHVRDYDD